MLCWACTIHKVQGATWNEVVISFKGLRAKGQAYVAFSRVTSFKGLHLLDVNEAAIKADSSVSEEIQRLREEHPVSLCTDNICFPTNAIRICFFNCQSLGSFHQKDIQNDPHINESTILALTETWHYDHDHPLPGFTELSSSSTRLNAGGAVLFYKSNININIEHIHVHFPIDATAGSLSIHILDDLIHVTIVVMYCPPKTPIKVICNTISSFFHQNDQRKFILGGDFNIDLSKCQSQPFTNFMEEKGLKQLSSGPTHQSGSHIDNIWTNIPNDFLQLHTSWTSYSDHKQLLLDINMSNS